VSHLYVVGGGDGVGGGQLAQATCVRVRCGYGCGCGCGCDCCDGCDDHVVDVAHAHARHLYMS
jgi:hypothetical protein